LATFTPNYNLRKPATSDLVNVTSDIGANMDLLDAHAHSGTYVAIDLAGLDLTGATDQTAAFQAKVTAAANGTLVFPEAGTLLLSAPIEVPSNTVWVGQGRGFTLQFNWQLASAGSTYIRNATQDGTAQNIEMRGGFRILGAGTGDSYGNATNPAAGILMRRVKRVSIEDVYLYRVPGINIAYQGCQRVRIRGNRIEEAGRDGITGWWYTDALEDVDVSDNIIWKVGDDGIAVHASEAAIPNTTTRPKRITIHGNTVFGQSAYFANGAGRGVILTGVEEATVTGNVVSDTFGVGIYVRADPVVSSSLFRCRGIAVTGNTINRSGVVGDATQPRNGLRITGTDDSEISGNTVRGASEEGIYVSDTTGTGIDKNTVVDNGTLITHFGIHLDGGSSTRNVIHCTVNGNKARRNAGGGIRLFYTVHSQADGNLCIDNGTAGNGSNADGSGLILAGDGTNSASTNRCTDSRAGGSKTQTHGIHISNAAQTLHLEGNDLIANNGNGINIGTTPTILVKRGNRESATDRNNYDQDVSGVRYFSGAGTPEGVVTAPVGSKFARSDGAAGTVSYIKETGTGNTGWVPTRQLVVGPSGGSGSVALLKPTAALAETVPRGGSTLGNNAAITSGTLRLVAIPLPSGLLVSSITFVSGSQAAVTPTNQWFTIHDSARLMQGVTADDTTTAWAANTAKTLNLGTPYLTTYDGLYYLGIMVAAGTVPSLHAVVSLLAVTGLAPVLYGNADTGQTTPPVAPFTAAAPTASGVIVYGYVS
jgi:parallel beta-helix repeat protein